MENKRAILEYWTSLEFFSPYLLDNVLDSKKKYQKIYSEGPQQLLPWAHAPVIREHDPTTPFAKGYHLYLGLFNIEETADRARHVFSNKPSGWQSIDWKKCQDPASITAFARLSVTTHGIPLFSTLSLSTLPWAHGRLLNGAKEELTIEEYWKNVNRFLQALKSDFSEELPLRLVKEPKLQAHILDVDAIHKLAELLFKWAGFSPFGYPLALIEPLTVDQTRAATEPEITSGRDVPILNSFYIQDLESAAKTLETEQGQPIDLYLEGSSQKERLALDSEEGAQEILTMVRPENTPSGRWPDPVSQTQSLMQQFAINKAFDTLQEKGIFSVNGPPGTGKTALLREIIAENIVQRATRLSQLKSASAAFIEKHAISFDGFDAIYINELHPSLLGFEMVVVSSNNTAVLNLSKELPLRSQLDSSFHSASYLEPVATKVFGAKEGDLWGLISAPLGNKENCRQLVERMFMQLSEKEGSLRIWEWIDRYKGPSFIEARDAFIAIKRRQEALFEELEELLCLHDEIHGHTLESFADYELKALDEHEEALEEMQGRLTKLTSQEREEKELLALLKEQEKLMKEERPNALKRMINRKVSKKWKEKSDSIRGEKLRSMERLQAYLLERKEVSQFIEEHNKIQVVENALDQMLLFHCYVEKYELLKNKHPKARLPSNAEELKHKEIQTTSYYHTEESNAVRSELFIAAMTLHEAWVADVLPKRRL